MPELPEVEIIKQSLNKNITDKIVKKVIVRNRNLRLKIPKNFENYLKNKKIIKVDRFSKYLIISLSRDAYYLIHLGMSGTIHIINKKKSLQFTNTSFYHSSSLPKKHNHVELIFDSLKLIYNDPRRFGFFQFIKNSNELRKRFNHLGYEPFDRKFNLKYVLAFFKGKNKDIKNFLIDQKFVSGIGNIYASEILFLSKINPNKKVKLLNKIECSLLIKNSKKVLMNAIKKGGSSIRDFKNTDGNKGSFQDNFNVYQREGMNCKRKRCKGKIIKKITINRSTFFCNFCQK
jgi:formamidopyrimidine-DNA glycosylase